MPTPSDDTATVPRTPPIEATSSRASFASCPPDAEEREQRRISAQMEQVGSSQSPHESDEEDSGAMDAEVDEPMSAAQEPTPESEADIPRPEEVMRGAERHHEKGEHVEDAGMAALAEDALSSSAASPADAASTSESEALRLTQSMSNAAISSAAAEPEPMYLTFPQDKTMVSNVDAMQPRATDMNSYSRASPPRFYDPAANSAAPSSQIGRSTTCKWTSKTSTWPNPSCAVTCAYKVRLPPFHPTPAPSGLIHPTTNTNSGLTDDHPTLTTFFEGEIIGPKHLFKTTHPNWGSSEKVDLQHWARFPAWRPLAKSATKSPNFTLKNYAERPHLFMRWKEYFLVPDHRVKTITGASFEGFYYICFNQVEGTVSGIYFHAKSEKYQQLELEHVDDRGCMGSMEFR
jgi:glucose-induced degradation protein 4